MKKNILIFGLISGLIVSVMLAFSTLSCYSKKDFSGNMVLGFTVMILAFSFIFIGIKNYRDKFNNGVVSFGKAFNIGLMIALIGSTLYVVTWLIVYYNFIPDFIEVYTVHVLNETKAAGASAAELAKQTSQMNNYKEMYKSPIGVILLTYMEILPVGLIITILSALILKRSAPKLTSNQAI